MHINLRDYQREAINKIFGYDIKDENGNVIEHVQGLFEKGKRSATVILPTGGGKSFVAMESICNIMQPSDKEGEISATKMCYFSPNEPIIYQIQLHIAEHMITEKYFSEFENDKGKITSENYKNAIEHVFNNFSDKVKIEDIDVDKFVKQAFEKIEKDKEELNYERVVRVATKRILENLKVSQIESGVNKALPGLVFKCYQGMKSKEMGDQIKEKDDFFLEDVEAEYVIFDEAHRAGAPKWKEKIINFIKTHKETKILNITATPERDRDNVSIMKEIAKKTGYTNEEIANEEYIAKELKVLDAMLDDPPKVITPQMVFFNCMLDETSEYKEVKEAFETAEKERWYAKSAKKADEYNKLNRIYSEMNKRIGKMIYDSKKNDWRLLSDDEWTAKKEHQIKQILEENINNVHGKAIEFIPVKDRGTDSKENIDKYANELKKYIKEATGKDPYVKGYHSTYSKKENQDTLQEFVGLDSSSENFKVIVTCKKLLEGVHVDGIEYEFDLQPNSEDSQNEEKEDPLISVLQKWGRCISSIDPEHPERTKKSKIFDMSCNAMRQYTKFLSQGQAFYELPKEQKEFLNLYQMYKDRSKIKSIKLRRNKDSSSMKDVKACAEYNDGKILMVDEEPEVNVEKDKKTTIKKGKAVKPEENKKLTKKSNNKNRLEKLVKVLEAMKQNNVDVNALTNITKLDMNFFDENGLDEKTKDGILSEIVTTFNLKKGYNLGTELEYFRNAFWKIESSAGASKMLAEIEFEKLVNLGIINIDLNNIPEKLKAVVNEEGFIMANNEHKIPEQYIGLNVKTGTKFSLEGKDEFGCYQDGYDDFGYDKDGFNKFGIHKATRANHDERFFYKSVDEKTGETVWKNMFTNSEVDMLGFNHAGINPETGFDRNNQFHDKLDNGEYSRLSKTTNNDGANVHGFKGKKVIYAEMALNGIAGSEINKYGFYSNGVYKNGESRDLLGYDIDGYDEAKFNRCKVHKDTSCKVNKYGDNDKGEIHPDFACMKNIYRDLRDGRSKKQIYNRYKKAIPNNYKGSVESYIEEKLYNAFLMSNVAINCKLVNELKGNILRDSQIKPELVKAFFEMSPKLVDMYKENLKALVQQSIELDERIDKIGRITKNKEEVYQKLLQEKRKIESEIQNKGNIVKIIDEGR